LITLPPGRNSRKHNPLRGARGECDQVARRHFSLIPTGSRRKLLSGKGLLASRRAGETREAANGRQPRETAGVISEAQAPKLSGSARSVSGHLDPTPPPTDESGQSGDPGRPPEVTR